jgi:T-complex protein 1 subunit theta
VEDMRNAAQVTSVLKTSIASHLYGFQDILAPKITEACIQVCPKVVTNFNVDNVRVAKIVGMGVSDTEVVKGFVLTRGSEGMSNLPRFFLKT